MFRPMRSALCFVCNVKIRPMKKSLLLNAVPADSTTRVHVTEVIGICSISTLMNRKADLPRGDAKKKECRYSIAIKVEKAAGEHDYTQSKFFGSPTVPNEWVERFYDDIIFLAQIRLSDIAEYDPDNILPHSGYLYFFLDAEMYPSDQLYVWVEYYDGEPDTIIDDFNELSPLPCGLNEDWLISFGAAPPDADGTKLLGLPSGAAGEDASLPKLLLQYDPLDFEGVPYLENVDGYAYVLFGRDEKDFDGAVYKVDRT